MNADLINGLFELAGAVLIFNHARVLLKDKMVRGVSVLSTAVFTAWGFWNLYYYPSLGQWWSFAGGVAIVVANSVWLSLMWKYRRNRQSSPENQMLYGDDRPAGIDRNGLEGWLRRGGAL